jgi:hypothetical protein
MGASRGRIASMIYGQGLRVASYGIVAGVASAGDAVSVESAVRSRPEGCGDIRFGGGLARGSRLPCGFFACVASDSNRSHSIAADGLGDLLPDGNHFAAAVRLVT